MDQTHKCSKCDEEKPWSDFQLYKGHPSGQCRACKTAAEKARRLAKGIKPKEFSKIEDGKKLCMDCKEMKELSEFSPVSRGLGGVSAYCKSCFSEKYRDRETGRQATAKYRIRHRERHLAAHRVRMFEYRTRKKVTDDGTVTDEFLKALYATSCCHYCKRETPEDKRTADHKIALINGGAHSASNLVMACFTCNSSKRDLSDEEFFERIENV